MRPLRNALQAKLAGQVAQLSQIQESWVKTLFLMQWGPRKGEWHLWGEEKHGEQVELSVREAEQCSRCFDEGASIAFG